MDPIARMVAAGAAGAGGGDPTYVDDVFSNYVYIGNGSSTSSTQTINNGIDISGEGGLVWIKNRETTSFHQLFDTERGAGHYIKSNNNTQSQSGNHSLSSFNSNGFTLSWNPGVNGDGQKQVSWTFRKCPGFFDVVTYTGNGGTAANEQQISHNLGSKPGIVIVKRTDASGSWFVFTDLIDGSYDYGHLEQMSGFYNSSNNVFTDSYFNVGGQINSTGGTYVAYVFANDDQSFGTNSDESIIKCGTYTGTGTASNPEIDLGFEPQWMLLKNAEDTSNWILVDTMRGWNGMYTPGDAQSLIANNDSTEPANGGRIYITPRGFAISGESSSSYNSSGQKYLYMAIRRPNKPPEDGTDVFAIDTSDATSPSPPQFTSGFVTDFTIRKTMNGANAQIGSRLQGTYYMSPYSTSQQSSATALTWDFMDGWSDSSGVDTNLFCYMFKRAPGFFDVVAYQGTGSTTAHNHNLGVTPELLIVKNRYHPSGYTFLGWPVYNSAEGPTKGMSLHNTDSSDTTNAWGSTSPTSTTFTTGTGAALNSSDANYVAYLFASLAGISKVGTYTGTGSAINVDCGFTAGARFVMIKRTDNTGHWYVWDTTNGIVSGNDPYWRMNDPSAAVTNTDYIDPLNAGFTVTASGQGDINASGGTYLFLAIA